MTCELSSAFRNARTIGSQTDKHLPGVRVVVALESYWRYESKGRIVFLLIYGFVFSIRLLFDCSAFSMNIPNLPMQMLAITESASASAFFSSEMCQLLITDGNAVADRLRAHFMTSPTGSQLKCKCLESLPAHCWSIPS